MDCKGKIKRGYRLKPENLRFWTLLYTIWYNFDTILYQFLETGTSDRYLINIVQRLRFSVFILDPLSFFLYSSFNPSCPQNLLSSILCPESYLSSKFFHISANLVLNSSLRFSIAGCHGLNFCICPVNVANLS